MLARRLPCLTCCPSANAASWRRSRSSTCATQELAPDFTLATSDGKVIQLSALRGRWVLVNFWATWCAPCRDEMPYLDSLATRHANRLTVLAVNIREPRQDVAAFVAELDLQLPVLLAPDDTTLLAYAVRGLPGFVYWSRLTELYALRVVGPVPRGVIEDAIALRKDVCKCCFYIIFTSRLRPVNSRRLSYQEGSHVGAYGLPMR